MIKALESFGKAAVGIAVETPVAIVRDVVVDPLRGYRSNKPNTIETVDRALHNVVQGFDDLFYW